MIVIKRAYEPVGKNDGRRVLVDRIWPRGMSKSKLELDAWIKDIAPSTKLRQWFGHDPERWVEFKKRYRRELKNHRAELKLLKKSARRLTLVYGARDAEHNHALVLRELLQKI